MNYTWVKNCYSCAPGQYHRYREEIPEPAPSLSWHGAPIWGIQVFPMIRITVICKVCMYCGLSVKIKTRKTPHGVQRSLTHFICVCFHVCGRQKPEYPQLELHCWRCHQRGGKGVLGSPFYICDLYLGASTQLPCTLKRKSTHTVAFKQDAWWDMRNGLLVNFTSYHVITGYHSHFL